MKSLFLLASLLLLLVSPCLASEGLSFETEASHPSEVTRPAPIQLASNPSEATRPAPIQLASNHQVEKAAAAQPTESAETQPAQKPAPAPNSIEAVFGISAATYYIIIFIVTLIVLL